MTTKPKFLVRNIFCEIIAEFPHFGRLTSASVIHQLRPAFLSLLKKASFPSSWWCHHHVSPRKCHFDIIWPKNKILSRFSCSLQADLRVGAAPERRHCDMTKCVNVLVGWILLQRWCKSIEKHTVSLWT